MSVWHSLQNALHMSLIHRVEVENDDLTHESNICAAQQLASLHESGATSGCTAEQSTLQNLPLSQSTAPSGRCRELHQRDWHVPDKVPWCQRCPVTFWETFQLSEKCVRYFFFFFFLSESRHAVQSAIKLFRAAEIHKHIPILLKNRATRAWTICPVLWRDRCTFKRLGQIQVEHFTGVTLSNYCQVLKTTTAVRDIKLLPCSNKQDIHTWFTFTTFI